MQYKSRYFIIQELVCPHVFKKYGEVAWQFFDDKLLMTLDFIREALGPMYVNNWDMTEEERKKLEMPLYDERGFRCIQCDLVKNAIKEERLYVSSHMTGQGVDFNIEFLHASKVRLWIAGNFIKLPFPIRLEKGVSWVHLDTRYAGNGKVVLFSKNPIK